MSEALRGSVTFPTRIAVVTWDSLGKTTAHSPEPGSGDTRLRAGDGEMERDDRLIKAGEAGEMLGLDAKTVLAGGSHAAGLTRVTVGKRGVRFSRNEVQERVKKLLAKARQQQREEEQKKADGQQHGLKLVTPDGDSVGRAVLPFRR